MRASLPVRRSVSSSTIDILRIDFPSYKFIKLRYNKYTITQLMRKAYTPADSEPNVTITSSSSGWLEHRLSVWEPWNRYYEHISLNVYWKLKCISTIVLLILRSATRFAGHNIWKDIKMTNSRRIKVSISVAYITYILRRSLSNLYQIIHLLRLLFISHKIMTHKTCLQSFIQCS